jgi:hypothetical protein
MQVPILSGIIAVGTDFDNWYPLNMVPVPVATGLSEGFLRPAEGIITLGSAFGTNRGGRQWRGVHYRVQGTQFLSIAEDGTQTAIGSIDGFNWCSFAESFDYLAINGGGKLYLYDGTVLSQVTDVDLGTSLDIAWSNGYFLSTDGEFVAASDITDPFSWNTLRYASSEARPDPVLALLTIRNEVYVVNGNTVEVFAAVSSPGLTFPFSRIEGAQLMKGAVGSRACCELAQSIVVLGGGINEPPAVWMGAGGRAQKLSVRSIDDQLATYTTAQLSTVVLESRVTRGHELLYVHLPDMCYVYDFNASRVLETPVWHVLKSGVSPAAGYRARGFVWCYDRWNVADPFGTKIGYLSSEIGSHYGDPTTWQFVTPISYNEGRGVQVHEIELVALSGIVSLTSDPVISTDWSLDGVTWSRPSYIRAGRRGTRTKRLTWDRQGTFRNWRVQRFSGDSNAYLSFARLEARVEALST